MIKLTTPEGNKVWVNLSTLAHLSAEHRLGQNGNVTKLVWPTQYYINVTESPEEIDGITELGI